MPYVLTLHSQQMEKSYCLNHLLRPLCGKEGQGNKGNINVGVARSDGRTHYA